MYEGAAGSADAWATAAGRVFDKLHAHLDRLGMLGDEAPADPGRVGAAGAQGPGQLGVVLGAAGVQALLVRSARVAHGEFACLEVAALADSTKLRECLRAHEVTVVAASAVALFAGFLALITAFIGERLTGQVLRKAWPIFAETQPEETEP